MQIIRASYDAQQYDILIENGMTGRLGDRLSERLRQRHCLLITDENVMKLYGGRAMRSVEAADFHVKSLTIPSGGCAMTIEALHKIEDGLNQTAPDAGWIVLALGGASLCDAVGCAMRSARNGAALVYCPTTLMGMADWAAGGRTASEKRSDALALGVFFPPDMTLIDPQCAASLSDRAFYSGMAEIIKCACALDATFFRQIEGFPGRDSVQKSLDDVLCRCLELKCGKPRDKALALLGHDIACALQAAQRYRGLTHGEAVAIGMMAVCLHGERAGLTAQGTSRRLGACLKRYHVPLTVKIDEKSVLDQLDGLPNLFDLAVPERVGWCAVHKANGAFLKNAYHEIAQSDL